MFEKREFLMICCDISKSFENVHLTCENSIKANKKNCIKWLQVITAL